MYHNTSLQKDNFYLHSVFIILRNDKKKNSEILVVSNQRHLQTCVSFLKCLIVGIQNYIFEV